MSGDSSIDTMFESGVVDSWSAIDPCGQTRPMIGISAAVQVSREVRADSRPGIAAIVAAIHVVARPVETRVRMRADDVRRVPVDAIPAATAAAPAAACAATSGSALRSGALRAAGLLLLLLLRRLRRLLCALRRRIHRRPRRRPTRGIEARGAAGATVETGQTAALRRRVDDVRIPGIGPRLEPVASADQIPVARANAERVRRPRRTAHREVVLRAAADGVERLFVADADPVVLRDGQIREEPPRLAVVVRLVDAAVVADQNVVRVARIERHVVVIDMHVERALALSEPGCALLDADRAPRLAAVLAPIEIRIHRPDGVGVARIDEDLGIVGGPSASVPADARQALAVVIGHVESAAVVRRWTCQTRQQAREPARRVAGAAPSPRPRPAAPPPPPPPPPPRPPPHSGEAHLPSMSA